MMTGRSLFRLFSCLLLFVFGIARGTAAHEVEINLLDKKVYLLSGEQKISVDTAAQYFSGKQLLASGNAFALTGTTHQTGSLLRSATQTDKTAHVLFSGTALAHLATGTELEQAIHWMYQNGLTQYARGDAYRPHDFVTREEAAKLMGKLFETLQFTPSHERFVCDFVDAEQFDPSLSAWIQQVCKRGIFRGNDQTHAYMPQATLTKGQILAVLTRMLEGKLSNEQASPWWIEYYVKMKSLGVTQDTRLQQMDLPLTRGQTALMIYRFKNLIIAADGTSAKALILAKLKGDFSSLLAQAQALWKQQNPDAPLGTGNLTGSLGT